MKIKILGAGIGGLSVAIALKQKGFDVEVYERNNKQSDIGAGIVCWPNASFVLKNLGMLDDIARVSGMPIKMRRMSSKGENLGALDILQLNEKMGYPSYSILRKDLMEIMTSHLLKCGVEINYGKKIVKLLSSSSPSSSFLPMNSTQIHFENGAVEHADVILGADGRMSSVARKFVNGDNQPIYQGFINWVGVHKSKTPIFSEIEVCDYWGVGDRFGIVPISSTVAYWAGAVAASELGNKNPLTYKADLLALFNDWPLPIKTIINETPLVNINKFYVHDHNPMKVWHRDNVLVIGDAAHASLPTSGQGACQALEDAWHFATLLESCDGSIETVFQDFTKIRFSKTAGITVGARQLASSIFSADEDACMIRNENSQHTDYSLVVNGMAKAWSSELPIHSQ